VITEPIYLGRDNTNVLTFTNADGTPLDFSGVLRMVLSFEGSPVKADSLLSNEFINWDSEGHVTFKLGALPIVPSKYSATLVAYDLDHDDGQVLFHAREGRVFFWFIPPD
jgi:hypothetical protein